MKRLSECRGELNWSFQRRGGIQRLYSASGTRCIAILSLSDLFGPLLFFPSLFLSLGMNKGLSRGYSGKESACQCTRHGFHSWLRKIPWRRKRNPLQYSCLENPHGQRSLVGYSPWGHIELDTTEQLSTCAHTHTHTHTHTLTHTRVSEHTFPVVLKIEGM